MRYGIEGVAFDLDGTLYPNYRFNVKIIPFLLKEWRLVAAFGKARTIIRKEQAEASFSPDFKTGADFYRYQAEITAKLLGVRAEPLQEKIDCFIYKGWDTLFKTVKLYKNVIETLAALKESGYKLGLLSDFPPETKLEYLGLTDFTGKQSGGIWDTVLCSEQCGALKPHPLPFIRLAAAMSLPCEKILYVGNSHPYDVVGACKAGMKTAWIRNPLFSGGGLKKPKPDFSFNNYRQLYNYMIN